MTLSDPPLSGVPRSPWVFLVVLALGVVLSTISIYAYRSVSAALEKQTLADLQAIAGLKAEGISRAIADQRNRVTVLSRAPLFIDFMSRPPGDIALSQRARTVAFMEDARTHANLDNLVLLDAAGSRIAAARDAIPDKPEWRAAAKQAIKSSDPILIDFRKEPDNPIVDLSFVAPVYAPEESPRRALGAVALEIAASNLIGKNLDKWPLAAKGSAARLIRNTDTGVLTLRDTGLGTPISMTIDPLPTRLGGIADRILHGTKAPISASDRHGIRQFVASAAISGTDWFLVASSPRDEALADATQLGIGAGALTVALVAIAIVAALLVEQRRRLRLALAEMSRQRAVQAAEQQLRAVFEQASLGIALVTPNGGFMRINRQFCEMFGYSEAEFLEINPLDLNETEEGRESSVAFMRSFESGIADDYRREKLYRRKDGSKLWGRVAAHLVRNPDGEPDFFITILEDITESKRQAEALRRSENELHHAQKMEAIGNLTGGMAHDFNNLLSVIVGNLDLARIEAEGIGDAAELIDDAIAAALRGAELTRRLLAYSRRQPLAPKEVAPNELVDNLAKLLRRTLGEDIHIALDAGRDIWPIRVDPSQLETALLNLANNARDAMPAGGTLHVATSNKTLTAIEAFALDPDAVPGDYALIEIADTGTGMSREVMARIFEPFFTTKEAGKGTGLGLSMVFGFIKQSGGHIAVESRPGRGTTFRLYLPRAAAEQTKAQAADALRTHHGSGERILVVEDNTPLRDLLARQLALLGYRVLAAADAEEAMQLLEHETVDLVFSDIVLPGKMDGFSLTEQLRARWPKLKVVLTSGFPDSKLPRDPESARDLARILSKPYRKDELDQFLREALDA